MDIYVLNAPDSIVGIVQNFESAIWNCEYFGPSDCEVNLPGTQENMDLLTPGRMLVRDVDIHNGVKENVMIIRDLELSFDAEKGWSLKVIGAGLKTILGQRVVWQQTTFENANVETAIRQVITENAISPSDSEREIPDLVLATASELEDTFSCQLFGENISEWLQSVCEQFEYGWDVSVKDDTYVFKVYKGKDRSYGQINYIPVVFSPEYDNLLSASYAFGTSEKKNSALIGGEGEGTDKVVTSIGTSSGLGRFETYVDGSSVSSNGEIITMEEYVEMLKQYGKEELAANSISKSFEGQIIDNGMYQLGVDYNLGDVLQISNGIISASSRMVGIIYSVDENGIAMVPTFGDWKEE